MEVTADLSSSQDIYIYYGSSTYGSSSTTDVFDFYEDFSGASVGTSTPSGWTEEAGNWWVQEAGIQDMHSPDGFWNPQLYSYGTDDWMLHGPTNWRGRRGMAELRSDDREGQDWAFVRYRNTFPGLNDHWTADIIYDSTTGYYWWRTEACAHTDGDLLGSEGPYGYANIQLRFYKSKDLVRWEYVGILDGLGYQDDSQFKYGGFIAWFDIDDDLASDANSGQKDVVVTDGTLFSTGQSVTIADDSNSETNTISSIASNTLTMQNNLANTYTTAANAYVRMGHYYTYWNRLSGSGSSGVHVARCQTINGTYTACPGNPIENGDSQHPLTENIQVLVESGTYYMYAASTDFLDGSAHQDTHYWTGDRPWGNGGTWASPTAWSSMTMLSLTSTPFNMSRGAAFHGTYEDGSDWVKWIMSRYYPGTQGRAFTDAWYAEDDALSSNTWAPGTGKKAYMVLGNEFSGDSNCVALYNLDSGALLTDSKGSNDLTDNNTVDQNDYWMQNDRTTTPKAADFNGTDEYLTIDDGDLSSDYPLKVNTSNNVLSVGAWYYGETLASDDPIAVKASSLRQFKLVVTSSGTVVLGIGHTGGASWEEITKNDVTLEEDTWYYICATFNDSTKAYRIAVRDVYGDVLGTDKTGTSTNNIYIPTSDTGNKWWFGKLASDYHYGYLDELLVCKDVLSADEITAIAKQSYTSGTDAVARPSSYQSANVDITAKFSGGGADGKGEIMWRANAGGTEYYRLMIDCSDNQIEIYEKEAAGSDTLVTSATYNIDGGYNDGGLTPYNYREVRVWHYGSSLKIYFNGLPVIDVTENTITSSGYVKFRCNGTVGQIDQIRMRTAISAEPDVTSVGSEEQSQVDSLGSGGAVSISVTPVSYDFGDIVASSIRSTGLTYFTITNDGSVTVDITIGGTDMYGGDPRVTWDLSDTGTAGDAIMGLKAGLSGGSYNINVKESEDYNTLKSDLAVDGTQQFGLQLLCPTLNPGGESMQGSIILVATEVT